MKRAAVSQVYAWGDNNKGQLGLSDQQNRYEPVAVEELRRWTVTQILAIVAGIFLHFRRSWNGNAGSAHRKALCSSLKCLGGPRRPWISVGVCRGPHELCTHRGRYRVRLGRQHRWLAGLGARQGRGGQAGAHDAHAGHLCEEAGGARLRRLQQGQDGHRLRGVSRALASERHDRWLRPALGGAREASEHVGRHGFWAEIGPNTL